MSHRIDTFQGQYRWLSNFWPVAVLFEGMVYPSVEHAYQAAKTMDPVLREWVRNSESPAQAKSRGRRLNSRANFEEVKLEVMRQCLRSKFLDPFLSRLLVETGDAELVEGNYWNDQFWGQCPVGTGENHLGKILMEIRKELRECQSKSQASRASTASQEGTKMRGQGTVSP